MNNKYTPMEGIEKKAEKIIGIRYLNVELLGNMCILLDEISLKTKSNRSTGNLHSFGRNNIELLFPDGLSKYPERKSMKENFNLNAIRKYKFQLQTMKFVLQDLMFEDLMKWNPKIPFEIVFLYGFGFSVIQ